MGHYSKKDSEEFRNHFTSLREKSKDQSKTVITRSEWNAYKSAGADMSRFVVLQDFRKKVFAHDAKRMKDQREGKWNMSNQSWNEF